MQGTYFWKKAWDGKPLPRWEEARGLLPEPILDSAPGAITAYDSAWQSCIRDLRSPAPGNGFVSNHLFVPFNDCIFAHDTAVMSVYGRYGMRCFDAAESFDNFYARQHETGEICREIRCSNGEDFWKKVPGDPVMVHLTLADRTTGYQWTRPSVATHPPGHVEIDGLNDPCALLWGELSCCAVTADRERLRRILEPQKRWYDAFDVYLRDTNGLYITDWASADNHPRNDRLGYGIDVACQVVLFARLMARLCRICGDRGAREYERKADALSRKIRDLMWNEQSGFFYALARAGKRMEIMSVAGFWPLMAGVADRRQAAALVKHLHNPKEFDRPVLVPTLAASEPAYTGLGSYYLGGVWPFTNLPVIEGLEAYGFGQEARRVAINFWQASVDVFKDTGKLWEYLMPEARKPGRTVGEDGWNSRAFTGWGAWAPISLLLEYAIGLRVNAPEGTLTWNLAETGRCGCRRRAFGDVVTDVVAEPRSDAEETPRLSLSTNKPYDLVVTWGNGRKKKIRVK